MARVFAAPSSQQAFKLSRDPRFIDKVRDIVGLYLNPPDRALVLCVDEKSQIQALDRTAPLPPMRPGQNRTLHARLQTRPHHQPAAFNWPAARCSANCIAVRVQQGELSSELLLLSAHAKLNLIYVYGGLAPDQRTLSKRDQTP